MRDESGIIAEENQACYRDCYDQTIQVMDLIETYRDMVTGLLDIYLSSVSYRLNEIMRVLTIIATIFISLTFIAGVYGMNFSNDDSPRAMPELHWYYGYLLAWLLMIRFMVGMLGYFRRKKMVLSHSTICLRHLHRKTARMSTLSTKTKASTSSS